LDGGVRDRKSTNSYNINKTNSNQLKEENASGDEHHLGHETSSRRLVIEEFQSTPAREGKRSGKGNTRKMGGTYNNVPKVYSNFIGYQEDPTIKYKR
jgi:hypothetical protein